MSICKIVTTGCFLLLIGSFAVTGFAQQGPPAGGPQAGDQAQAPGGGESRFDQIVKAVHLSAEQETQVQAVLAQTDEEIGALREEFPTWNEAAKAAIDQVWVRETARMLAVLNADQRPTYEAYIKAWLEERSRDSH